MGAGRTSEGQSMNAAAFVDAARGWARGLEDREVERSGADLAAARLIVSRKTGVSEGTLRSLRKNRLKAIGAHVFAKLREGVVKELEAELMRLEHELSILRQTGVDPRDDQISEVVADIARARTALGRSAPALPGSTG